MRLNRHKRSKFKFYMKGVLNHLLPSSIISIVHKKLLLRLEKEDKEYIKHRVDYYMKKNDSFLLSDKAVTIQDLNPNVVESAYYYDMLDVGKFFPKAKFDYLFGDITYVPETPCFLKSRPIGGNNNNSVLLKLNQVRHFNFINDSFSYEDKKDMIIWRGKSRVDHHRFKVCEMYFDSPMCDIALSNPAKVTRETHLTRQRLTIEEQLKYKFILSMEGNDVATNLKWILSSNSLCFMRKPKYETWFMEGALKANFHYVLLKDDFSDLLEKVDFYIQRPEQAKEIIKNANKYIEQFLDYEREKLISLLVMNKYVELARNIS